MRPALDFHQSIGAPAVAAGDPPYYAGYVAQTSLAPGDPLDVYVATRADAPCFADVYRVTGCRDAGFRPSLRFVARSGTALVPARYPQSSEPRRLAPGGCDADGCGWPAQRAFGEIPSSWRSGLYLVQFTSASEPTGGVSERLGQDALFVLRPAEPCGSVLLQLGVATWSAYHLWGDRNLYGGLAADGGWHFTLRSHRVSFARPGIGMGTFNQSTWAPGKQSYAFKFIEWSEQEGIALDYCTGLDLDSGAVSPDDYRLLLTVGHDEYWTGRQRDVVERFVAGGGNAAFFGGNLAYWQIRSVAGGRAIECHKRAGADGGLQAAGEPLDPLYRDPTAHPEHRNGDVTVEFCADPVNRPTTALTGVSMRAGGDAHDGGAELFTGAAWWWEDLGGPERPALGFTVCRPDHWAFDGTALREGDVFGEQQRLVGFECDGLDADVVDGRLRLTGRDGPLPGTEVIAFADARGWAEIDYAATPALRVAGRRVNEAALGGVVTMVSVPREDGGHVFTAPCTDWAFALVPTISYARRRSIDPPVVPASAACRRITSNVIQRLGSTH